MKNPLPAIKNLFVKFGKLITQALREAHEAGLDDKLLELAIPLVRAASTRFVDNNEKREWVVGKLKEAGTPEWLARVGTEFAYKTYRRELAKHGI